MNTSIYIPKKLARDLDRYLQTHAIASKNSVVVEAIAEFLEKHQDAAWNETIINWEGAGEGIEIDHTDLDWEEFSF